MKITFSPAMSWDVERESILFHAHVDGKPILCVAPREFLTAPYVEILSEEKARAIFDERKSEIEAIVEARIREGTFDPAGEIVLYP